ncbi:MAG: thiamine phosphate synthase [Alphaproteobacteria bacterium]
MKRQELNLSLYFVADPHACAGRDIVDVVKRAVAGGATLIQLRNKIDSADIIRNQALSIQKILADSQVPFLINDHVEVVAEINADGVHIGQGDMNADQARELIGHEAILGLTAFTHDHYAAIDPDIVDYVGTGPVFPTKTDKGKPVLGVDGFSKLIRHAPVPVVGIGGITEQNAVDVMKAGAHGVAMMRSISEADDPCIATQRLLKSLS